MVFISAILALLLTNVLFLICLLIAFVTAERKRNLELRRLDDRIDRLTERALTPSERAGRASHRRRTNERRRRALEAAND